jgi:hypothetical protein
VYVGAATRSASAIFGCADSWHQCGGDAPPYGGSWLTGVSLGRTIEEGLATAVTFTRTLLAQISFVLAAAAAIFLLVVPIYWGSTGSRTLMEVNGEWVTFPVLFPVITAFLPVVFRKQVVRVIATVLMGGFVMIASFSIGFLYLPAALVMLLASCSGLSSTTAEVRR